MKIKNQRTVQSIKGLDEQLHPCNYSGLYNMKTDMYTEYNSGNKGYCRYWILNDVNTASWRGSLLPAKTPHFEGFRLIWRLVDVNDPKAIKGRLKRSHIKNRNRICPYRLRERIEKEIKKIIITQRRSGIEHAQKYGKS